MDTLNLNWFKIISFVTFTIIIIESSKTNSLEKNYYNKLVTCNKQESFIACL